MTYRVRSAEEHRTEIQAKAAAMGVDEAFISTLVDSFYTRIRRDERLGPIFNNAIHDWDAHMPTMKAFWASVALSTGQYSGKPVPSHMKLKGIEKTDFQIWLGLFHKTLEDIAPSEAAITYFMQRADRIAASLQLAMFGLPELNSANHI